MNQQIQSQRNVCFVWAIFGFLFLVSGVAYQVTSLDQRINLRQQDLAMEFMSQVADEHLLNAGSPAIVTQRMFSKNCQSMAFSKGTTGVFDEQYAFAVIESNLAEFNISADGLKVCVVYYKKSENQNGEMAQDIKALRVFGEVPKIRVLTFYHRLVDLRPVHLERLRAGGEPDMNAFMGPYQKFLVNGLGVQFGGEKQSLEALHLRVVKGITARKITVMLVACTLGIVLLILSVFQSLALFGKFFKELPAPVTLRQFLFAKSLTQLEDSVRKRQLVWAQEEREKKSRESTLRMLNWRLRLALSTEMDKGRRDWIQVVLKSDDANLKQTILDGLEKAQSEFPGVQLVSARVTEIRPVRPKVVEFRPAQDLKPQQGKVIDGDMVFTVLHKRATELCRLEEILPLLPEDVSASIVRAVVFALLKPASRDATTGECYRQGRATFRMVRHLLKRMDNLQVSDKEIGKVLQWLVKKGVVRQYKGKGPSTKATFSLENNWRNGETAETQELIRRTLRWRNEFHNNR